MTRITLAPDFPNGLLPTKLVEFFLGANELHGAVIEKNAAALWVVVVECEQFRSAVLIPARLRFEEQHRVCR